MVRVAVVGAGPSGLVTLRYLLAAEAALGTTPVEVKLFEQLSDIGGTFRARTYEDGELVSSRQLTTFSDFRWEDGPDFFSVDKYLRYLNDYCTHFKLWPHINFSCLITSLEDRAEGGHILKYESHGQQHTWGCDAVAICSGLHVEPSIPHIDGIDKVPVVMHSSEFRTRSQLGVGKNVFVLGSGETGADLSYLSVTSPTNRVVLCHRNGFHLAPKRNPNPMLRFSRSRNPNERAQVPIDVSRASLFDTAYVHPWLRRSSILWTYYDYYVRWISWVSWGTTHGSDQWIGEKPKGWSTSEIFFNKSGHKISPYMNARWKPKRPKNLLQHVQAWLVRPPTTDTKGREIEVAPWPERIDDDGILHFTNNGRPEYLHMRDQKIKADVVVFCTGYEQNFPFLKKSKLPTAAAASGFHPNHDDDGNVVRDIWHRSDPSIGFIGFVRPNLGAIPPLAEMQAQLWVLNLLASERIPRCLVTEDESHYRLVSKKNARIRYGVDHESYAYQLALDMDSALSLGDVLKIGWKHRGAAGRNDEEKRSGISWKLLLTWALGANFNTKFRLRGPWKWEDGAVGVITGELWDTVARRQWFFGHFTLSILPMLIFGPLSLLVYIFASVLDLLRGLLVAVR